MTSKTSGKSAWDKEKTRELFRRFKEEGDMDAREKLVMSHLNLVRFIANKFKNRGEPIDDLIQVGYLGLLKAIDRFDPSRGLEFTTFATPTIMGEIKRHFRDKAGRSAYRAACRSFRPRSTRPQTRSPRSCSALRPSPRSPITSTRPWTRSSRPWSPPLRTARSPSRPRLAPTTMTPRRLSIAMRPRIPILRSRTTASSSRGACELLPEGA